MRRQSEREVKINVLLRDRKRPSETTEIKISKDFRTVGQRARKVATATPHKGFPQVLIFFELSIESET